MLTHPRHLVHHPIVLPEEDGVHGGEGGLLAGADVPGHEALPRLGLALLVGLGGGHHHLAAPVRRGCRVQPPASKLPQTVGLADILTLKQYK